MKFKNAYDKTSMRRTIRTVNLFYGEISVRRNIHTAKVHTAKFPYAEISYGEISYDEISYDEIS